jgi:hypothetical protein
VADADEMQDFYGLQGLILHSVIESGECFVRFKTNRNQAVPLQFQVLESEFLENTTQLLPNGNRIVGGIELNPQGRRIAYHLHKHYPGDDSFSGDETVRIPAKEILHIYKLMRPGQIRGEPWLARVLLKLHELDQYDDAELVRKKTAAMFAGFVTRLDPESSMLGETAPNEVGQAFAGLEPGTMQFLEPGEDVRFSQPGDVGGTYEAFIATHEFYKFMGPAAPAIAQHCRRNGHYVRAAHRRPFWRELFFDPRGTRGIPPPHRDDSAPFDGLPIFAGGHKNDLTPHEPLSDAATVAMQSEINRLYGLFVETVARNRGLLAEQIRATEAGMFFGEDAIKAGLADGFRTFEAVLSAPNVSKRVFLTTNQRRTIMKTDQIEENQPLEAPETVPDEINEPPEKPDNPDEPPANQGFETCAKELIKLCKIAKRPELLPEWLERGLTVAEAQESLLKEMESNNVEIISARTSAKPKENPLIQAAKNRRPNLNVGRQFANDEMR